MSDLKKMKELHLLLHFLLTIFENHLIVFDVESSNRRSNQTNWLQILERRL